MVGLKPAESFTPTVEKKFDKENVIIVFDAHGGPPIRRWYKEWKPEGGEVAAKGAWVETDDLNDGKSRGGKEIKDDLHDSAEGYVTFGTRLAESSIKLIEE